MRIKWALWSAIPIPGSMWTADESMQRSCAHHRANTYTSTAASLSSINISPVGMVILGEELDHFMFSSPL